MQALRRAISTDLTRRTLALGLAILIVGGAIGFLAARLTRDPHSATAELLTGTVTWSHQNDRLIAFEADGVQRNPLDGQTFYHVISDELNFPACLTGTPADPVREDRRRVTLEAIHRDFGGRQQSNVAFSLRCL